MNKLLPLLLLFPLFLSAASKFRELPYEQKIKDERASFILTFDKKTTYADKARGTALSTLPNVDLMLRSYTGYDGRNAFSPAGSEKLEFPMLKNLDMRQGTLIMWVKCVYDIATCGNNGIFNALLSDGKNNTRMFIYLYKGGAHASWRSSLLKVSGRNIIHLSAPLKHIREGQWFQVALTWDRDHFKFYINGKLAAERNMPPRARQCQDLVLDPDESWIGFNTPNIWSNKNDQQTQIDDIRIYPVVLTPLELNNQYAELLLEKDDNFAPFMLTATGIPERPYDKMELDFNFGNQLPAKVNYEINGPDGLKKSGVFSPSKSHEIVIIKGINRKGKYFLAVTADYQGNGGKKTLKLEVTRPDLEYLEDVSTFDPPKPPTPFLPVKIDAAGKSVEVWNRKIVFANGPLPTAITIKKQNLFTAPPVLTVNGKPIQWTDSKLTAVNPKMALLTGNGKGKGF
ncbi:MAG: LamG domain-containing protein, partial [Lentisphaeria bacterium]|nr:LamG domain-containing protein [Lentisphaeria bacterium]